MVCCIGKHPRNNAMGRRLIPLSVHRMLARCSCTDYETDIDSVSWINISIYIFCLHTIPTSGYVFGRAPSKTVHILWMKSCVLRAFQEFFRLPWMIYKNTQLNMPKICRNDIHRTLAMLPDPINTWVDGDLFSWIQFDLNQSSRLKNSLSKAVINI